MDDTADYTAAAAIDPSTPKILRIASFQISPNELVEVDFWIIAHCTTTEIGFNRPRSDDVHCNPPRCYDRLGFSKAEAEPTYRPLF